MLKTALSLTLLTTAPALVAQSCPIAPTGSSLGLNGSGFLDAWTAAIPIGFAFPFAGATYTDMYLSDHGLIALNNAGTPAAPPAIPLTYTVALNSLGSQTTPMLAPFWSDHSLNYASAGTTNDGEIWVDNTSGTHCTISWIDVETYIDGQPFSFQCTLFADGSIVYKYDNRVCNEGSSFAGGSLNAIIGMSPNGVPPPPAALDLSTGPVSATNALYEEFTTTAPLTCNPNFDLQDTVLTFFPTSPGWVVVATPLVCASKTNYGAGCDGVTIDSNNPVIGTNWDVTVSGISISPIALVFFGATRVDPGLPLSVLGINAPGCNVHIANVLASVSAPVAAGSATVSVPVPLDATIKGTLLTAQGLVLTLANPGNLATSGGLEGEVGF